MAISAKRRCHEPIRRICAASFWKRTRPVVGACGNWRSSSASVGGTARRFEPGSCGRGGRSGRRRASIGPASRLTAGVEPQLRSMLRQQPDLTLAELQQRLAGRAGVDISRSRLWVWLQRLGLRHKKNHSGAGAGKRRKPLASPGVVGAGKRVGSRRAGVSRRKRRDHGDDPPLGLGTSTRTRLGSGARRPLAHPHRVGRAHHGRRAGQHDH